MLPGQLLRSICSIVLHYKATWCRQDAYAASAFQLIAMHVGEAKLDLPTLPDNIDRLSKHFVCDRCAVHVPAGLLAVA